MSAPEIILASASPRREHLLREHGLRFRVVPPADVPELLHGAPPDVLAMQNAARKAANVAGRFPDAVVIGADTIVVRQGQLYGKPADLEEAYTMLGELVGREHQVFTGVGIIRQAGNVHATFCEVTRVWMRPLTPEQIRAYCAAVDVLDKAGAYGIQEQDPASLRPVAPERWTPAGGIVERIDGSFSNVMGLPMERLTATLNKLATARWGR